jgi:hypothetical protein
MIALNLIRLKKNSRDWVFSCPAAVTHGTGSLTPRQATKTMNLQKRRETQWLVDVELGGRGGEAERGLREIKKI